MATIDLSCRQSFCLPPHSACPCAEPGLLYVGGGYRAFLFPQTPSFISLNRLKQARLILFKIPQATDCPVDCLTGNYCAYPLKDFFSIYGCCYAQPEIDEYLGAAFCDDPCRCVLEIDVTDITRAWLNGSPENYGIALCGGMDTPRIACASRLPDTPGMCPILRLVYEGEPIYQPLSVMDCIVTVST